MEVVDQNTPRDLMSAGEPQLTNIEMEYLRVEYSNAVSHKCLSSRSPWQDRLMNDRFNVLRSGSIARRLCPRSVPLAPVSQFILLPHRFTGSYHIISYQMQHIQRFHALASDVHSGPVGVTTTPTLETSTGRPRPRRSSVLVLVLVLIS